MASVDSPRGETGSGSNPSPCRLPGARVRRALRRSPAGWCMQARRPAVLPSTPYQAAGTSSLPGPEPLVVLGHVPEQPEGPPSVGRNARSARAPCVNGAGEERKTYGGGGMAATALAKAVIPERRWTDPRRPAAAALRVYAALRRP